MRWLLGLVTYVGSVVTVVGDGSAAVLGGVAVTFGELKAAEDWYGAIAPRPD